MRILALDMGTSSVKAAVLDAASAAPVGTIARVAYALDHPVPEAAEVPAERLWQAVTAAALLEALDHPVPEAAEVPAERLWQAVTAAARAVAQGADEIAGVGLSCLTPALVLLDNADRPLAPIWTHLDRRARPAARQVWAAVGPEFLAATGNRPLPGGISAVSWRQQLDQDPYFCRRTRWYLHANSWLALRMTGERAFDPANASFSGLYETLTTQTWSERWCHYFEVERDWLPPVVSGATTLGTLRSAAATELGVPAGLPVKLGTADTSSAMLAAGMGPGDLLHVVGTTQVLAAFTDHPQPSPQRLTRHLGVGSAFIHVTHNPVGGAALDWLHHLCFRDQSPHTFYEHTIPDAMRRTSTVTLDPPYLGGDRLEIEAHRAGFRDLTLGTDRLDLAAALLEAMRRRHREALTALGVGEQFARIFLTGGGAAVVRQLLPEYAGPAVHMLEEGSLRGVARLFQPASAGYNEP
jgi:xylulokinase